MAQDPFEQGAVAARILLDELNGGEPRARSLKMPVTLIERTSTAPPRLTPAEHRKKRLKRVVWGAFSCARLFVPQFAAVRASASSRSDSSTPSTRLR